MEMECIRDLVKKFFEAVRGVSGAAGGDSGAAAAENQLNVPLPAAQMAPISPIELPPANWPMDAGSVHFDGQNCGHSRGHNYWLNYGQSYRQSYG